MTGDRTEQQIFGDLETLCTSPGYAHAIAFFWFRDNVVGYKDELKGQDYAKLFSPNRLIRTEISTLIGLMARGAIDLTLPSPTQLQAQLENSERLLKELHNAMMQPFVEHFHAAVADRRTNPSSLADPFETATAMREPIFYGGEAAYSFQYCDLAPQKYARDEQWLKDNKGYSIEQARKVTVAIADCLNERLLQVLQGLKSLPPEKWSLLDGFKFSVADVVAVTGLASELVEKILQSFAFSDDGNPTFTALQEFNATNAYPLLRTPSGDFILFQYVSLAEAIYDTPFYWMADDSGYVKTALANRGLFAEEFSAARLGRVFGADRVLKNVDIWQSKGRKLGEIDTLVLFADRAIVVQAKSKKLTIAARKGNDLQLKEDFKGAVQDACDQAYVCAQHLSSTTLSFTDNTGKELKLPQSLKQIFPICVVTDHYPALSAQSRQFLKYPADEVIQGPLVCDVFFLDVLTEMLETPLRCLSYLDLRARAGNKLVISHELTALGFHLKQNLWLGEYDLVHLEDDLSADLDVAMSVRRLGVEGEPTPPGILTQLLNTSVGSIIEQIEKAPNVLAVELGFQLLKLSSEAANDLSAAIDKVVDLSGSDGLEHDATVALSEAQSGITVHCNDLPNPVAAAKLKRHCELRKYSQRATKWFGMLLRPGGGTTLAMAVMLNYPWIEDKRIEGVVAKMPKGLPVAALKHFAKTGSIGRAKIGRNERCPCGSGLKYKRCCLRKENG